MIIRCAECGGEHVYDLGMNVDKNAVDITPINNDEELNLNTLPYYIGGYYCADCQTFVSIIEEPEPADMKPISEKQKTFLQSLIKKLKIEESWPDEKINSLNQKDAGKLIWGLKKKYDKRPKKKIAPATEKQKAYVKDLIEKSEHKARYATIDIDTLNVLGAGKLISALTQEKEAQ